jgi:DNA-binding transcriptional regulator YiaG
VGVVPVTTVDRWPGREAKLLRQALRLSIRDFAMRLGVGARTVNKWEAQRLWLTTSPDNRRLGETSQSKGRAARH